MLTEERLSAIYEYIKEKRFAHVSELSQKFYISETSIRRDLTKLERAGLVQKTYGGALIPESDNEVLPLEARSSTDSKAKSIMAQIAVSYIRSGDILFMDSSSTVLALVPFLQQFQNLTVITHGLHLAYELVTRTDVKVYSLGGLISAHTYSANGMMTIHALENIRANKFFFSPKGISLDRIYCASEEETEIRRMMMNGSDETYLLCSHHKFEKTALFQLCTLAEIDHIITDEKPSEEWINLFSQNDINLHF